MWMNCWKCGRVRDMPELQEDSSNLSVLSGNILVLRESAGFASTRGSPTGECCWRMPMEHWVCRHCKSYARIAEFHCRASCNSLTWAHESGDRPQDNESELQAWWPYLVMMCSDSMLGLLVGYPTYGKSMIITKLYIYILWIIGRLSNIWKE